MTRNKYVGLRDTEVLMFLRAGLEQLDRSIKKAFPIGAPIKWRTENSFVEEGAVTAYVYLGTQLVVRVTNGVFHSNITIHDILRAVPDDKTPLPNKA